MLLYNLLNRFLHPPRDRHDIKRHIYTIQLEEEVEKFMYYHRQYSHPGLDEAAYVNSVIENMVAHFEYQTSAVQSFVGHYATLITEGVSPQYMYHPLRFLKPMDTEQFERYVYCLYGFAEAVFRLLETHGMYDQRGILRASYEGYQMGVLYLIVRPEVPDVFTP